MATIEEENQLVLDEADAMRLEYDFFNKAVDEFAEGNYVDPAEVDIELLENCN